MGRKIESQVVLTGGKDKHYMVRFQHNGKRIKRVLRDRDGKYVYDIRKARALAREITAPMKLEDDVVGVRMLQAKIDQTEQSIQEARQTQANERCTLETGWNLFLSCPDLPRSLAQHSQNKDIPKHSNIANYHSYYKRFCRWCSTAFKEKSSWAEITTADAQAFVKYLSGEFEPGTVG